MVTWLGSGAEQDGGPAVAPYGDQCLQSREQLVPWPHSSACQRPELRTPSDSAAGSMSICQTTVTVSALWILHRTALRVLPEASWEAQRRSPTWLSLEGPLPSLPNSESQGSAFPRKRLSCSPGTFPQALLVFALRFYSPPTERQGRKGPTCTGGGPVGS